MENVILLFMTKPNVFKSGINRRIRNTIDFVLEPRDREEHGGKSLTVQDEARTVEELYERVANGISMAGHVKEPVYGSVDASLDSLDLEKVGQLDLFDRQELAMEYGRRLDEMVKLRKAEKVARELAQEEQAKHARLMEEGEEKPSVSPKSEFVKFSKSSKKLEGKSSQIEDDD